ncbi:thioredoxin reductase [Agromyces sp. 3263]|uniref:NAD(P)/FAD-dependent oxidoreductase n=1 Tax=Agromyces sp. 3263 TaxID=2817750 RepID=UPI0028630498|nr:NAD(P)/FAD-dependent oxidoreductase [Agromyces sp. 3263]MDR6905022.1 thioredoxin reductase [Agromyces sp. 3263]
MQNSWDVIIIGGGSAGLSAALMLGRARRRVLVLDAGAPRNGVAAHMHGVLGRDGWSPLDLLAAGRDEVRRYGVVVESGEVAAAGAGAGATRVASGFEVVAGDGTRHLARRLLVATGVRDGLPELPGLAEQWGSGAVVCPYCDGWEVRDRRIGVLAAGPMALHQAQLLRQWSPDVTYFVNGTELPADAYAALVARGIGVESREVVRVVADEHGRLSGIRLADCAEVPIDSLFLQPLPLPNDAVLRSLGAATTEQLGVDWVAVDADGRTSVPGLWAAGNVVSARTSVPIASGAGNAVGAAINADLVDEEIREALAAGVTVV